MRPTRIGAALAHIARLTPVSFQQRSNGNVVTLAGTTNYYGEQDCADAFDDAGLSARYFDHE